MASCDGGLLVSIFCFIASVFAFALGVGYIILKVTNLSLEFGTCGFFQEDCNHPWRSVFTLRPEILLDLWTPVILGMLGMSIHLKSLQVCPLVPKLLPVTYLQYAFFMVVTALFASIGYMGKAGVIVGAICLVAALACVVMRLLGEVWVKQMEIPK